MLVVMAADQQWMKYRRSVVASHFNPPGPAVCFDESQSGVQRPLPFPTEAECFKLFLTEELVGSPGVEETNRYALELHKREPGVWGNLTE
jgi:hypothetical protein